MEIFATMPQPERLSNAKMIAHEPSMGDFFTRQMYASDSDQEIPDAALIPSDTDPIKITAETTDQIGQETLASNQFESEEVASNSILVTVSQGHGLASLLCLEGEDFVAGAYRAVLGRAPDPEGLTYYSSQLRAGQRKVAILADMRLSKEGRAAPRNIRGLTAIAWILRIRQMPPIKQIFDFLVSPWGVARTLQRIRYLEMAVNKLHIQQRSDTAEIKQPIVSLQERLTQLAVALPQSIDDVKAEVLTRLVLDEQMNVQFGYRLDQLAQEVGALISRENAEASRRMGLAAESIQAAMTGMQAEIVRQVYKASTQVTALLPQTVEEAKAAILARLALGAQGMLQVRQNIGQHAVGTAALIARESAGVTREVGAAAAAVQAALTGVQADLARQAEASTQLGAALPQTVEEAKAAILARLALGESAQDQLLSELGNWGPQFGRIETYSMAAARRIAVPCGPNAVMIRSSVGYVLCSEDDHALMAALVERGELEPGTRHLIQRLLVPGDVFLDVGANIGMHSIAAAKAMRGRGRVIAFEPYSPTAILLRKSVWINGLSSAVSIYPVAVADHQGMRTLYLGATSGHHSLFPLGESPVNDGVTVDVQAVTIDEVMANDPLVTLMKIDVEGAELEVLKGAQVLLASNPNIGLIVEFGGRHLRRTGVGRSAWLSHFDALGMECQVIDPDSGLLNKVPVEDLDEVDSVNLFFARQNSPLWGKVGLTGE